MTTDNEKKLIKSIKSLEKEIVELKNLVSPFVPKQDTFLNTREASELLGVSIRKLQYMIADGEITFATMVGKRYRFSKNALLKFISNT